ELTIAGRGCADRRFQRRASLPSQYPSPVDREEPADRGAQGEDHPQPVVLIREVDRKPADQHCHEGELRGTVEPREHRVGGPATARSEERRVGKECREWRWRRDG